MSPEDISELVICCICQTTFSQSTSFIKNDTSARNIWSTIADEDGQCYCNKCMVTVTISKLNESLANLKLPNDLKPNQENIENLYDKYHLKIRFLHDELEMKLNDENFEDYDDKLTFELISQALIVLQNVAINSRINHLISNKEDSIPIHYEDGDYSLRSYETNSDHISRNSPSKKGPLDNLNPYDDHGAIPSDPCTEATKSNSNVVNQELVDNDEEEEEFYFCYICYCSILKSESVESFQLSNCSHRYCRSCLVRYVKLKISEGVVEPKCFYLVDNPDHNSNTDHPSNGIENVATELLDFSIKLQDNIDSSSNHDAKSTAVEYSDASNEDGSSGHLLKANAHEKDVQKSENPKIPCNAVISSDDIFDLIKTEKGSEIVNKYQRFKFMKENENYTECPFAGCNKLQIGNPDDSVVICCR
jgi:hypothetical protein